MPNNDDNLDYCSVISLCPFPINEMKPGMTPSYYNISKCKDGEIEVLIVRDAFYIQGIPATNQTIKVTVLAKDIARSLVNDYIQGVVAYKENCYPALFWVRGIYNRDKVKAELKNQVAEAQANQRNWFEAIVKMADDDWAQWHQHKFITDNQRFAASYLGLDREWLMTPNATANLTQLCPACKSTIHIDAAICANCRAVVDSKKAAAFKFATTELVKA